MNNWQAEYKETGWTTENKHIEAGNHKAHKSKEIQDVQVKGIKI